MKTLNSYINEQHNGSKFADEVKYSNADFNKWMKHITDNKLTDDIVVSEEEDLTLIYLLDGKTKKLKHIATYNKKSEVLSCDDIKLFGNEIK